MVDFGFGAIPKENYRKSFPKLSVVYAFFHPDIESCCVRQKRTEDFQVSSSTSLVTTDLADHQRLEKMGPEYILLLMMLTLALLHIKLHG